jgi:hypothetical protein
MEAPLQGRKRKPSYSAAGSHCQAKEKGEAGNVFNIIGNVVWTLEEWGLPEQAKEFQQKAVACHSYDEVLRLCMEYVEVC